MWIKLDELTSLGKPSCQSGCRGNEQTSHPAQRRFRRRICGTFYVMPLVVVAGPFEVRKPGAMVIDASRQFPLGCLRRCWLLQPLKPPRPNAPLGRDWPKPRPLSDARPPGCLKTKAPSFTWTFGKKMSSATGGRAPLLTREEGSSLAVGTTPGEARPRGHRSRRPIRRSRTNGGRRGDAR